VTYTDEKLKDIGGFFGVGESGVSQVCRWVKDKIKKDKKLERKISKIEKKIKVGRMKTCPLFSRKGARTQRKIKKYGE